MKRLPIGIGALVVGLALALVINQGRTQTPPSAKVDCKVAECAQMMVDISNKLLAETSQLKTRLTGLQTDLENVKSQSLPAVKSELQTKISELMAVKPTSPNKGSPAQKDDTGKFANEGTVVFPLRCDEGQVAVGIDLTLGGTCHEQCNGDGRPVQQFKLVCRALQIAR
ncbi:hypothetical protein ACVIW2_003567 [Bradyrhizobium huanghuaihaiense]